MISFSDIVRSFDLRHVGTCPTCMRISFVSMILSWLLAYAALMSGWSALLPIALASGALTLVWLAHVTVRPIQAMLADQPHSGARRGALRTLAKGVLAATLVSAFPWQAYALSGCGGWAGNSGCRRCKDGRVVTGCMRQDNDCTCYTCRSCGNNCGTYVC
jgi:hypothetical protein